MGGLTATVLLMVARIRAMAEQELAVRPAEAAAERGEPEEEAVAPRRVRVRPARTPHGIRTDRRLSEQKVH